MSVSRSAALVTVIASAVMFTNLGGPRLWDRDEPRNAGCAREMMARYDWVTPVFNDELRSHKPVLLYWLMMSAYSVLGVSEFAARFWSAALAVGTVLCTWSIGRRLFGLQTGIWSGLILSSCLLFAVVGRAATPDAALVFFSTLALAIYVHGTFGVGLREGPFSFRPTPRTAGEFFPGHWLTVAAIYFAMGLAVLTKGPVGLVMPTAVIGMFLLIVRLPDGSQSSARTDKSAVSAIAAGTRSILQCFAPGHFLHTCWSMRPLTALAVSMAVALPWYVWVGIRTDGEFLRGFFFEHNFGRATASMEGHTGSFLYYPASILVGFFPWSVLLAPVAAETIASLKRKDPRQAGTIFVLCWIGVYVGLFTLARTKLPNYVAPCYPALALLAGNFLHRWSAGQVRSLLLWRRLALGSLSLVGVALLIALPLAAHRYLPGEQWLGIIGLVPLIGGVACLWWLERAQPRVSAVILTATATVFVGALLGGVAHRVSAHQQNHLLLAEIAARGSSTRVSAFGLLEPTWIFYGDRPVQELHVSGNRTSMGQWVEIDGRWQAKPPQGLVDVTGSDTDELVITTDRHLTQLEALVSGPVEILADVPFFLKKDRLLLVRLDTTEPRTARRHESKRNHASDNMRSR